MAENNETTRFQFGDLNPQAELANIAKHHINTSVCAGGRQIYPTGPCDHCGSVNPSAVCLAGQGQMIGTPLTTE
jgi:hypothetical protein